MLNPATFENLYLKTLIINSHKDLCKALSLFNRWAALKRTAKQSNNNSYL